MKEGKSDMSGGLDPTKLVNPATLLGTALGGPIGAIIAQAIQQVVSTVVQDILQKAGEQMGVPQPFIDSAQSAFAGAVGDWAGSKQNLQQAVSGFSEALGQSGARAGNFVRDLQDNLSQFIEDAARQVTRSASENGQPSAAAAKGGSVPLQIALAIGSSLDQRVDRMASIARELGDMGKVDGDNMSHYQELSAEMNALGQEIKIVSEALNNALKSIGEASSSLARKQ
jgi:archaellum component FlaC